MNLNDIPLDSVVAVDMAEGPQYFKHTAKGLEGPFIDEKCLVAYMNQELREEIDRNAMAQRLYRTGKLRRYKQFTMTCGTGYHTDGKGVIHRDTPRMTKKQRRALTYAKSEVQQKSPNPGLHQESAAGR
mgnify:CR=1 FL=1